MIATTLVALLLATEPTQDAATRAAAAAEKAAAAAQLAAEAAARAAAAAERVSADRAGLNVVPATMPLPAAPIPPAPVASAPPSPWTSTVGFGLMSLTGNSRSITGSLTGAAERKTDDWILGFRGAAAYGESRSVQTATNDVVAKSAGLLARLDRRFTPRYSTYLLGSAETDHVKSVELRAGGEVGAGIIWLDTGEKSASRTQLRTDLGFRVMHEERFRYYPTRGSLPSVDLYAPRAGIALRHEITKDLLFSEDAEVLQNVSGESRVLASSVSKLTVRLSRSLAFGTAFTIAHDSEPAADKVPTDTALTLSLDILL